ncbi:MAG TPA: hypothetical protein VM328_06375, partial [Fimbriimonadaceae bacterium]|nr:hypothetical protein [Fimbriimonadaceae bacterium]
MTSDEIIDLAGSANGPCVSIYVPTLRSGKEVAQGGIHLKNLLADAESRLAEEGHRWDEIESLTASARPLITDQEFWQHQADGLAIFLSTGFSKMYKLPIPVPPRQTVADSFEITPLLPMLSGDGHFYILTVSANDVRLFDATRFGHAEVFIEDVPRGMAEALHADDPERQLQFHSGAGASPKGGGRSAMFFGAGDEGNMERQKVDFKRYFDKVDAALAPTLKKHPAPVVLAGVAYLLPIYRKANTSATLLEGEVHGNQDRTTPEEIHQAAWEIAAPHFEEVGEASVARFHQLLGTGLASEDETAIAEAATAGRVDTLFVSHDLPDDGVRSI